MNRALRIITAILVSNLIAWILLVLTAPVLLFIQDLDRATWKNALFIALMMTYFGPVHILTALHHLFGAATAVVVEQYPADQRGCGRGGERVEAGRQQPDAHRWKPLFVPVATEGRLS